MGMGKLDKSLNTEDAENAEDLRTKGMFFLKNLGQTPALLASDPEVFVELFFLISSATSASSVFQIFPGTC